MALDTPSSATEIAERTRVDISRALVSSNPFLRNSWLGAFADATANRNFDFYLVLAQAQREAIPDTAVLTLEQWANIWGVTRNAATFARGNVVFGGTAGVGTVVIGTVVIDSEGITYAATQTNTVTAQTLTVTLTSVGGVATATSTSDHLLASNIAVTISGAVEPEYNVTDVAITVTSATTFTYPITGSPSSPATGTITAAFDSVSIDFISFGFGESQNQVADTQLSLQSPIADIDAGPRVGADALTGGADQETDAALRLRLLERIQNPIAHFSASEIIAVAKTVSGVTRVFVEEVTPLVGQVTVYFMRDNDTDPIPSAAEVTTVKNAILTITPANTDTADVIVAAPTPKPTAFTFSAISPDTSTMQAAIESSLQSLFSERTVVGEDVEENAYVAAIANTIDLVTGEALDSFTQSTSGDITIASGEIGTLGTVTFT